MNKKNFRKNKKEICKEFSVRFCSKIREKKLLQEEYSKKKILEEERLPLGAIVCEPNLSINERIEVVHWTDRALKKLLSDHCSLTLSGVHQVHQLERVKGARWSLARCSDCRKVIPVTFSAHTCELFNRISNRTLQLNSPVERLNPNPLIPFVPPESDRRVNFYFENLLFYFSN